MTTRPHDALFKTIFSQPDAARELFWDHLSEPLRAAIDWSTLTLESGSTLDTKLDDSHTDLLFSAEIRTLKVDSGPSGSSATPKNRCAIFRAPALVATPAGPPLRAFTPR